jgi:hypothetical protein
VLFCHCAQADALKQHPLKIEREATENATKIIFVRESAFYLIASK